MTEANEIRAALLIFSGLAALVFGMWLGVEALWISTSAGWWGTRTLFYQLYIDGTFETLTDAIRWFIEMTVFLGGSVILIGLAFVKRFRKYALFGLFALFAAAVWAPVASDVTYLILLENRSPLELLIPHAIYGKTWVRIPIGPFLIPDWMLLITIIAIAITLTGIFVVRSESLRGEIRKSWPALTAGLVAALIFTEFLPVLFPMQSFRPDLLILTLMIGLFAFILIDLKIKLGTRPIATKAPRSRGGGVDLQKFRSKFKKITKIRVARRSTLESLLLVVAGVVAFIGAALRLGLPAYLFGIIVPALIWSFVLRKRGQPLDWRVLIFIIAIGYLSISYSYVSIAFSAVSEQTAAAGAGNMNWLSGIMSIGNLIYEFAAAPFIDLFDAAAAFNIAMIVVSLAKIMMNVIPAAAIALAIVGMVTATSQGEPASKFIGSLVAGIIALFASILVRLIISAVYSSMGGGTGSYFAKLFAFSASSDPRISTIPVRLFAVEIGVEIPAVLAFTSIAAGIAFAALGGVPFNTGKGASVEDVDLRPRGGPSFIILLGIILAGLFSLASALTSIRTGAVPTSYYWMLAFAVLGLAYLFIASRVRAITSDAWSRGALMAGVVTFALVELLTMSFWRLTSFSPVSAAGEIEIFRDSVILIPILENTAWFLLIGAGGAWTALYIYTYPARRRALNKLEMRLRQLEIGRAAGRKRLAELYSDGKITKNEIIPALNVLIDREVRLEKPVSAARAELTRAWSVPEPLVVAALTAFGTLAALGFAAYHWFVSGVEFPLWIITMFPAYISGGLGFVSGIVLFRRDGGVSGVFVAHWLVNLVWFAMEVL